MRPRLVRLHYKSLSTADETGGWLAAAQVVITHTRLFGVMGRSQQYVCGVLAKRELALTASA